MLKFLVGAAARSALFPLSRARRRARARAQGQVLMYFSSVDEANRDAPSIDRYFANYCHGAVQSFVIDECHLFVS